MLKSQFASILRVLIFEIKSKHLLKLYIVCLVVKLQLQDRTIPVEEPQVFSLARTHSLNEIFLFIQNAFLAWIRGSDSNLVEVVEDTVGCFDRLELDQDTLTPLHH